MSWANHFAYCLDSAAWIVAGMDEVILASTFFGSLNYSAEPNE